MKGELSHVKNHSIIALFSFDFVYSKVVSVTLYFIIYLLMLMFFILFAVPRIILCPFFKWTLFRTPLRWESLRCFFPAIINKSKSNWNSNKKKNNRISKGNLWMKSLLHTGCATAYWPAYKISYSSVQFWGLRCCLLAW